MKYQISRSTVIDADIASVRSLITDFNQWNRWSPWTIAEPDCKISVEGYDGEPGHMMCWDGEIIGSGTNTLVELDDSILRYDLVFLKPFKSKAAVSFELERSGDSTKVTWNMDSSMPFFLFFMVNMMKALIEMDYDRGLRMLKEIAEKGEVKAVTKNEGRRSFDGFSYVGIKRRVRIDEMKKHMPKDFEKIVQDVVKDAGKGAKHWLSLYPKFHAKTREMTYIAAVSDEQLEGVDLGPEYVRGELKSGDVLEISHQGSFDFIGNAWSMGMMYVRAKKMKQRGIPFEYYHNNPLETPEEDVRASVFFQVK